MRSKCETSTYYERDACTQLRAASKQYAIKKAKYDAICIQNGQNGFKFAPLIFESTSKFHQVTETFFNITMNTMTHGMHREFASISKYGTTGQPVFPVVYINMLLIHYCVR